MANEEHINILSSGPGEWDRWRLENPDVRPDLSGAYLTNVEFLGSRLSLTNLSDADLSWATLVDAELSRCNFDNADLSGALCGGANILASSFRNANLSNASLFGVSLINSSLQGATLEGADLRNANLSGATLQGANLRSAQLNQAILNGADLTDADLRDVQVGYTTFGDNDLSRVRGLESMKHSGPSVVGVDTIYRSRGMLPEIFLRGCGVSEDFITYMRSLTVQPIQFYKSFISYSGRDQKFADRLYADLQSKGVRCWYAPEDLKIGAKIRTGIDEAIRLYDKLLLVLSKHSVESDWVEQEVETALERERKEKRTMLFPIRLDDAVMKVEGGWPALVRNTRNIGDFRRWKLHDSYQKAFDRLLRDLKAEGEKP
jgi:uncharacterized protein YjbI with pentapeptide repeats